MDWATRLNAYAPALQAAAGVVALAIALIAVIVPARQQRHRDQQEWRERQLKAKCLATAIRLELHDVLVALGGAKLAATARAAAASPAIGPVPILECSITIPPALARSVDQLYLLGDPAGPTLLRLVAILNNYNRMIQGEAELTVLEPAVPSAERWRNAGGYADDVVPKLQQALAEVSAIADQT